MKAKLNKEFIDSLKHTNKMYKVWDTELKGYFLRVMPAPSTRKTFAVFYRVDGKGRDFTLGAYGKLTPDLARKQAKQRLGEVEGGLDIQEEKKERKLKAKREKFQTLGGFLQHQYTSWAETHLKGHTEQLRLLNRDFKHLHGTAMSKITPWVLQKWSAEKMKEGLQPTTINRRSAVLKSVLAKAAEWGFVESSHLKGAKQFKIDKLAKPRHLSSQEEKRLRDGLEARQERQRRDRDQHNEWRVARKLEPLPVLNDKYTDHMMPIVLVALNTGLRRGELFNLKWQDVDLKGRLLTIVGSGAKSGHTRHIPLNDEAFAALVAWSNQTKGTGLVFPSPVTGERLDNISTAWANLVNDAELIKFRFHDLRHSFASNLVMRGVDLNTTRELLGHANIEMTLRYAHLAPEHKAAAVALLNTELTG